MSSKCNFANLIYRQAASQKRKRQERDALFREQAASRKRAQAAADEEKQPVEEDGEPQEPTAEKLAGGGGRQRVDKSNIPDLLPAELLESDDEDAEAEEAEVVRKPKKIKLDTTERMLERHGKAPGDRAVGSTMYRVTKKQDDPRLAAKARPGNTKKNLLESRRAQAGLSGGMRKKGFFVKR